MDSHLKGLENEKSALKKLNNQYKKALKLFSNIFNKAKQKEKYQFIFPVYATGFTRKQAFSLGFNVSKHLWYNCANTSMRNPGIFLAE